MSFSESQVVTLALSRVRTRPLAPGLLAMLAIIAILNALLLAPVLVPRRSRHGPRPRPQDIAIAFTIEDNSDSDGEGSPTLLGGDVAPSGLGLTDDSSPKSQLRCHNGGNGRRELVEIETVVRRE